MQLVESLAQANIDFEIRLRQLVGTGQFDAIDLLIIWGCLMSFKQKEIAERLHTTSKCVKNRRIRMKTLWRKMI